MHFNVIPTFCSLSEYEILLSHGHPVKAHQSPHNLVYLSGFTKQQDVYPYWIQ